MDLDVRVFVVSQLLVIIVPVGLLFWLWVSMLSWGKSD